MPGGEEPVKWESLAKELGALEQMLAIVHRRDDAQRLAQLVGEDCLHLSARISADSAGKRCGSPLCAKRCATCKPIGKHSDPNGAANE